MIYDDFNRDENDEITDEQYFSEDDGRPKTADDEVESEFNDDDNNENEENQIYDKFDDEQGDDDYEVTSINDSFLRVECNIKIESSKTPIRFRYRGEEFKGIVIQKMNEDNYIFLVKQIGKNVKKNAEKFMKKIYIPDAVLI